MSQIEEKIKELGLELPAPQAPKGIYHPVVIADKLLYVSGMGPYKTNGELIKGKVGKDLTLEEGQIAARQVGLAMLSTIRAQIGDLNRVKRMVKTLGMVTVSPILSSTRKPSTGSAS